MRNFEIGKKISGLKQECAVELQRLSTEVYHTSPNSKGNNFHHSFSIECQPDCKTRYQNHPEEHSQDQHRAVKPTNISVVILAKFIDSIIIEHLPRRPAILVVAAEFGECGEG